MGAQQYIWFNGKFRKFEDVTVHVFTQTIQYGTGIFEGIRSYPTADGNVGIFRLNDHVDRFFRSAEIYLFDLPFTREQIRDGIIETVKKNKMQHSYIRPFAFYDHQGISLDLRGKKMNVSITTIPFGNYFANKDKGITCMVSSWHKINSGILPPQAKVSGNYLASIMSMTEAKHAGYDESILMDALGHVAEGSGENIFLVKEGEIITPSKDADILIGITRDSVIKIATKMGMKVVERGVHREELYTADEVFFTGTAAEITPIINIDGRPINGGKPGKVTKMISEKFSKIVKGEDDQFKIWLTKVH
ncbi:MAG: branched-chain amino acid transaminase [Candidatus Micrarchaeota archaeon]|nr:branched-chain amino acid transaminase [Candidatus Micrarchaeota archaeon]